MRRGAGAGCRVDRSGRAAVAAGAACVGRRGAVGVGVRAGRRSSTVAVVLARARSARAWRGSVSLFSSSPPHPAAVAPAAISASSRARAAHGGAPSVQRRQTPAAVRAVVDVLGRELAQGAAAQAEVLDGPRQVAGRRRQRQDLADDLELLAGLAVDVDLVRARPRG